MSASSTSNSHQRQQIFMRHADVTISADSNSTSRSYKTAEMETEEMFVETDAGKSDETAEATGTDVVMGKEDIEEPVVQRSEETANSESTQPTVARSEDMTVEIYERFTAVIDEESMSIEDLLQQILGDAMLPFVLAAEPTIIKFSNGISILGVADGDL
ncbi:hypothetical protein F511_17694 [Dorcoceras hygrometricum]|uniref:Uncharacterized protein n=1 Tax=Dorcoceras hygrometricum TaxID=472368 RepID=A0A2Z6ZZV1_9LAMI|nr:hypothetical protein F511_17694 [Dorcoceras hygrometricum]